MGALVGLTIFVTAITLMVAVDELIRWLLQRIRARRRW